MAEQIETIPEFSVCDERTRAVKQAEFVFSLIPKRGISVDERARCNGIVREEISKASDLALFYLALGRGHQLSRVELIKRLRSKDNFGLLPLFEMLEFLGLRDSSKGSNTLFELSIQKISGSSIAASQGEVSASILHFISRPIGHKTEIIEEVLGYRPDAEQIASLVTDEIRGLKCGFDQTSLINEVKLKLSRSKEIRVEREK